MMIKIFIISACVAASANAVWEWKEKDNNPSGSRIRRMADANSQFANIGDFPDIPDMPNFDNLFSNFPEIKIPEIKIPEIKIPELVFPEIKIPDISPKEIASHKEREYHGLSMVTVNGETVITLNNGGNVETCTVPAGASKEETSEILAGTVNN